MQPGQAFPEAFPAFNDELVLALRDVGHSGVAEQFAVVSVNRVTQNKAGTAGYIYVSESRPLNAVERNVIGVKHGRSIRLSLPGMIVVDLDNFGRVRGVELL